MIFQQQVSHSIPCSKQAVQNWIRARKDEGYTVAVDRNGHYTFSRDGKVDSNIAAFIAPKSYSGAFITIRPAPANLQYDVNYQVAVTA